MHNTNHPCPACGDSMPGKWGDVMGLEREVTCNVKTDEPTETVHRSVMMEAEEIVNGPRRSAYGHPRRNFSRIVGGWNWYLGGRPGGAAAPITEEDHALMLIIVKIARLQETPGHRDSIVDICGYAGTYELLLEKADE